MALDSLMTVEELSERYGIPTSTLANWRATGKGPAFLKVGKHIRYRKEDIEAWELTRRRNCGTALKKL